MTNKKNKKLCLVKGCDRIAESRGFCPKHYAQYRNGIIDIDGKQLRKLKRDIFIKCLVDGCLKRKRSKGFCATHYQQYRKGFIDVEGKSLKKLITEISEMPSYKSIIEVHNGIGDSEIRAYLKALAQGYPEFKHADFNRIGRSYQELVKIHNNTTEHIIRKNTKAHAAQMSEFNDADFNKIRGKYSYAELVKLHNNSNDNYERNKFKNRARYRPEYDPVDFDNEKRALDKYLAKVEKHNASTNSIVRSRIKQRLKGMRGGTFYKEEHFNRMRKKYNYKDNKTIGG